MNTPTTCSTRALHSGQHIAWPRRRISRQHSWQAQKCTLQGWGGWQRKEEHGWVRLGRRGDALLSCHQQPASPTHVPPCRKPCVGGRSRQTTQASCVDSAGGGEAAAAAPLAWPVLGQAPEGAGAAAAATRSCSHGARIERYSAQRCAYATRSCTMKGAGPIPSSRQSALRCSDMTPP